MPKYIVVNLEKLETVCAMLENTLECPPPYNPNMNDFKKGCPYGPESDASCKDCWRNYLVDNR